MMRLLSSLTSVGSSSDLRVLICTGFSKTSRTARVSGFLELVGLDLALWYGRLGGRRVSSLVIPIPVLCQKLACLKDDRDTHRNIDSNTDPNTHSNIDPLPL